MQKLVWARQPYFTLGQLRKNCRRASISIVVVLVCGSVHQKNFRRHASRFSAPVVDSVVHLGHEEALVGDNVHRGLANGLHAPFPLHHVVGVASERPQVKMGSNTREQVGCECSC